MNDEITFRARVPDLSKAARLIVANRGSAKDTDFVDFLVSECIATLRSVGSSTEIPVQGIKLGTARLPLGAFDKDRRSRSFVRKNRDRDHDRRRGVEYWVVALQERGDYSR